MKSNRFLGLGYLTPYIIGLLVFTAIPFLGSLYLSFTRYDLMSDPTWAGLANYERLFTRDRTFMKSLNVTLFYVFLTVPLKLALSQEGPAMPGPFAFRWQAASAVRARQTPSDCRAGCGVSCSCGRAGSTPMCA